MPSPGEPPDVAGALGEAAGRSWCPHLAMLLSSLDELHPALAAFYRLGAGRNGWVFHRSLPEHEARDRAGLQAAGLDVATLEAEGRFALSQAPVEEPPESWADPWLPVIDERLGDGFDAVWWSRFPVGVDDPAYELALRYDAAWDAAMHDRRAVSLCVYVVGGAESRAEAAGRLAEMHDGLLHVTADRASLEATRER
jgi:MEDS: MEthanogen/methylotroph, DcmR Sensory domain